MTNNRIPQLDPDKMRGRAAEKFYRDNLGRPHPHAWAPEEMVTLPRQLIEELIEAANENSGAEPSKSVYDRAVDLVREYLR